MNNATLQTARPSTGTQEWAASNVNIQDGCEPDCRYCYAKTMAIRFKRATPSSWKRPGYGSMTSTASLPMGLAESRPARPRFVKSSQ